MPYPNMACIVGRLSSRDAGERARDGRRFQKDIVAAAGIFAGGRLHFDGAGDVGRAVDDQQAVVHARRVAGVVDLDLQIAAGVLRVIAVDGHRGRIAGGDVAVVDDVAGDRAAAAQRGAAVDRGGAAGGRAVDQQGAGADLGRAGVVVGAAEIERAGAGFGQRAARR